MRTHRATRTLATTLALATIGGCDRAPDGERTYATMPRLALEPGVALCSATRSEGCDFVDVAAGAVGPDGRVALAGLGGEVAQFDAAGHFVRRVGRRGRGPGEYREVSVATYDSSATLTVFDVGGWRLVRFDSAGGTLDVRRVAPPPAVQDAAFAGGRLVFFALPGGAAIGDSVTARFLGVDSADAATVPLGGAPARAIVTGDGSLVPVQPPFAARPRWAAAPDGAIHFADGSTLRVVRADGAAPRVLVALDAEGPVVTETELDSARTVLLGVCDGAPTVPPRVREQAEAALARAARRHPMVTTLAAVGDGMLWARESRASAPDSVRWNGFGADGRPHGWILLPVRARILAGGRDRLLITTYDGDGVPIVRWYAVRPAP